MDEKTALLKKKKRKRKKIRDAVIILGILFLILSLILYGIVSLIMSGVNKHKAKKALEEEKAANIERVLSEAESLSLGYDYDAAISLITECEGYEHSEELLAATERYEEAKKALVPFDDIESVTHVFFHTLIADNALAFDGDYKEAGYNQYMTTVSEFNAMLEEMYKRGYILVSIHDLAKMEEDETGNRKMTRQTIMIPEGRIPFVMSQDDVCYYSYMTGDGFATRLVVGTDGKPTCEYVLPDGTVTTGDYDLVPLLDRFIEKHPDFSYRGAKACLALTGYDGVLGYRTSPSGAGYSQEETEKAKTVAEALKKDGYEFASHSWGHLRYGDIEFDRFAADAKKWNDEVTPIIGKTDVMIYANGFDIAGIERYSGERYELLKNYGFDYFCNVDSHKSWVQLTDGYLRQGRRNLDGYRMYHNPELLEDLFDSKAIFDPSRPVPVPEI